MRDDGNQRKRSVDVLWGPHRVVFCIRDGSRGSHGNNRQRSDGTAQKCVAIELCRQSSVCFAAALFHHASQLAPARHYLHRKVRFCFGTTCGHIARDNSSAHHACSPRSSGCWAWPMKGVHTTAFRIFGAFQHTAARRRLSRQCAQWGNYSLMRIAELGIARFHTHWCLTRDHGELVRRSVAAIVSRTMGVFVRTFFVGHGRHCDDEQ